MGFFNHYFNVCVSTVANSFPLFGNLIRLATYHLSSDMGGPMAGFFLEFGDNQYRRMISEMTERTFAMSIIGLSDECDHCRVDVRTVFNQML